MHQPQKLKVLFLCMGNSCRSQMAEGWARHLKGRRIEAYSAGIEPKQLDRRAVKVMAEAGVDISGHSPKHVDQMKDMAFDYVVTVCDQAHEQCPYFPAKVKIVHAGFDDPPRLAAEAASEQEAIACYRRVRDEIKAFIEGLPLALEDDRVTQ
jgi:arsenate reductase